MKNSLKKLFSIENNPKFELINTEFKPFEIFKLLNSRYEKIFIFESLDGPKELVKSSIIGFDPKYQIKCMSNRIEIYKNGITVGQISTRDPFQFMQENFVKNNNNLYRYVGGLVGYVCYESIKYWEDLKMKINKNFPLMEFGFFDDGIIYDHEKKRLEYFYYHKSRLSKIYKIIEKPTRIQNNNTLKFYNIKSSTHSKEFQRKVSKIKTHLQKGDVFQTVLSKKIVFSCEGNPLPLYEELRKINPSPYMFYFRMESRFLLGSSPEMLLRITDKLVESYPIAGSRPVSKNKNITEKNRINLLNDLKEIAEHTMLVDLARNDLGRVCVYGSVKTPQLMKVKQFSHIQHLVSQVIGSLDDKFSPFEAFKAVFPAGTVTGAPKIRAMQIINELEDKSRGPYAGAIGYFSLNGSCDFAITIRSVFINGNKGYNQSGAGIVIDSKPKKEFQETEDKSNAITSALKMFRREERKIT